MSAPLNTLSDELLARYLAHSATKEEIETVEKWLSQFPEKRKELSEYRLIWELSGKLKPSSATDKVDRAWERVRQKMQQPTPDIDKIRPLHGGGSGQGVKRYPLLALAMTVAAALALMFGLYYYRFEPVPEMVSVVTQEQTQELVLPDGTSIFLNHHSHLEYPAQWKDDIRTVSLEGEAFFDVHRDEKRPFVISTLEGEVRVLGTSFNVNASKEGPMRVDVVSGKVEVSNAVAKKLLVKGQGAEVQRDTILSLMANTNLLGYKTQIYDFKATHLADVVESIRNGYHVDLRLAKSNISNCRLTIRFEKEPLDATLAVIAETLQLELRKDGDTYWLEGAGCR
ncbi:ferric-dicitrate binding protein FerR (iron transport regulator) [Dyadobacter jejuensis]|uniref:Ferric-dicitrate binding protein FerR (Iron transport regulator) n=1 Tax=Dyadobacter jejuensis TaxID=1082580 RepID=A0A316AHU2_9BACT|nr:FecR domain-containing protein [Dyadobacter jejuensis]PWJ57253.1 ferric-dicitrate binding protein FerR (iron transport regulator) [Dyadobacter jejuensis]